MIDIDVKLNGLSVMVGIPAGRDFHPLTVKSLLSTFRLLQTIGVPCELGMVIGSSVVQWARDEVVDIFLKSEASHLFWIDSDMVWKPDDFMRLLALSVHHEVVCATYPAKVETPTFYVYRDDEAVMAANEHGLIEVWGAGLGFTVMQRKVLAALAERAPKIHDELGGRDLAEIFRVNSVDEKGRRCRRGEDIAFFSDVRDLGFKVLMDPQVDLGHMGVKQYTGSIRDALQIN